MPAATPIQIRYGGDPASLGGLALATGTARRQYADYQNQLASDRSFLRNELSRRTDDTRYRNNFNLSLLGMQANERAAREQATALQEASGFRQRQAAQTGSVGAPIARAGQPVSLVPEQGPIEGTQPGGGGYIDFRDGNDPDGPIRRVFSEGGKLTRFGGGELTPEERGGYVGGGQPQQGIPADRRSAMERVKLAYNDMPAEQWNALWTAVQEGSLDPAAVPGVLDDIRASQPGKEGRTPGEAVARSAEGIAAKMYSIETIDNPRTQVEEKLRFLGYKVGSREYARAETMVDELWEARTAGVTATLGAGDYTLPGAATQRGMLGSSSSNPVDLSEPSDAKNLPSGTYFRTPDGRILKRK